MYLLDTNICIYIINKKSKHLIDRVKMFNPHQLKLSSVALGELEYGVSKSSDREKNRNALLRFVSAFDIVEFNEQDAELDGLIRASLEKKGQIIGPYDLQIAAQALTRNLILVTNNIGEFKRVPKLKYENWV